MTMPSDPPPPYRVPEMNWLMEVMEISQPLSETNPIWVRESIVLQGLPTAAPERHPYCEINISLAGEGSVLIEAESGSRFAGSLELLGPGVPHWGRVRKYPVHALMVYFLPSVLIEMGPVSDGLRLLRRFTAKQSLADRVVRPSKKVFQQLKEKFQEILREFEGQQFGREVKLRTLLAELLVVLFRWEMGIGRSIATLELEEDWRPVMRTLQFLRVHYTEPVYAAQVARAAGVSESRLKVLFHEALGVSWVKFLQSYRIVRAAALLHTPGHNVTETALAVGFESLSHFNSTFRSFMGASPKDYMHLKHNPPPKPAHRG